MNLRSICLSLLLCLFLASPAVKCQTRETQINNLVALAKLGGDIRYFSPTDAVHQALLRVGWDQIFVNATRIALHTKDERAFADSLVSIFKPLEPSLMLAYKQEILTQAPKSEQEGPLVVGVQHKGMEFYSGSGSGFKSIRTNRRSLMSDAFMSDFDLLKIKIPEAYYGKVFELKINHTVEDPVDVSIANHTGKQIMPERKLSGKNFFILRDTITPTNAEMYIKVSLDEFKGGIGLDSVLQIGNEPIAIKTFDMNVVREKPAYNIFFKTIDKELFAAQNKIGDTLYSNLTSALSASFPLAVYGNETETFPKASYDKAAYRYNKGGFEKFHNVRLLDNMSVKVSNILSLWNAFRYAFVYNPLTDAEEEHLLRKTINAVLETKNLQEYYDVVWGMLAVYKDAHIFFNMEEVDNRNNYSMPFSVIDLNDKYYIRKIHNPAFERNVNIGDEILGVGAEDIEQLVKRKSIVGSGSAANKKTRLIFSMLYGEKDSASILRLRDQRSGKVKELHVKRDFQHDDIYLTVSTLKNTANRMLDENTYYFNLAQSKVTDTLLRFIEDPSKHIIFEMRGYLKHDFYSQNILNKLITDTVKHQIFYSYEILSPKNRSFRQSTQIDAPENQNKKAKFYFLTDRTTQSAPETFLDIVKFWKIGKIIGQPTAGANGNINYLYLPGGMMVTFSGLKVMNSDGSTHHLLGVQPDYLTDFTLEDIMGGRDPYIDTALKIIADEG
ncbi:S41 family peptidase [Sphingobacterium psychroaquaticum]|uniref:C-terminal processing protease CtpA/Prc, contains a PDZ domain n=1 Tax=Sphingobacterium psychroaquaticum TaxID=561061 RepID=A0A1X7L321_9SPHI|nr:S41 family peptidase [Sphingobacterium psychroaquaticum]SMG47874.1 C-terminal processing protease CtpA/Prc, contains a PDZ domain [Sphingobacterium psychroaquaticum]